MGLEEYVRADVTGVYEVIVENVLNYAVTLKCKGYEGCEGLILPIFIGEVEAMSIKMAMEGISYKRPLTHDLIVSIFETLGVEVERVTIDALIGNIYTATLVLKNQYAPGSGGLHYVDSRPSDAIAIAIRVKAPIYVAKRLLKYAIPEDKLGFEKGGNK